jgi:hypothetical protein
MKICIATYLKIYVYFSRTHSIFENKILTVKHESTIAYEYWLNK